jgi:hypothetical protein
MWETERFDVSERVAESKARLADKLSELARRVDSVRDSAQKAKVIREPWFVFAAAVAIGFTLGARRRRPRVVSVAPEGMLVPGIGRSVIREILIAAAGAMTRRYIAKLDG